MSELHRKVLIPFILLLFFPANNIISSAQKARWRPEQVLGNPGLAFDSAKVRLGFIRDKAQIPLIGEQEVGFKAGSYDPRYPLVIDLVQTWNTFLGSSTGFCSGRDIAVDTSGNVYVTGESSATWGSPVRPFAGWRDAFVAKLNNNGDLLWNTFLGGPTYADYGIGIAVDTSGNVYVAGYSNATWGSPVSPFAGSDDAFAAKLNNNGALQWNTFLGGSGADRGTEIAVDTSGNVYVAGYSNATWGSPVSPFAGSDDAFAAKLNNNGALQWNTFLGGSTKADLCFGLAVDTSGNVYLAGDSYATWGSPVRPFAGIDDVFAAKLNNSGVLQWNTFLGSLDYDFGGDIAVDTSGNVYVAGNSYATWGLPVRPYAGGADGFAAKLNNSGALQWNTFLGGSGDDFGRDIAVDTSGNISVTGESSATWGSPVRPFAGVRDAFAAKLNNSGALQLNTFLGGSGDDFGGGIAVDTSGNVYVTGTSYGTWGSPVRPFAGSCDAFIAKIDLGIFPPLQFSLQRLVNNLIFYKEYINRLTWTANPMNTRNIIRYKIYARVSADSASAFDLLVELPANVFSYDDRGLKKGIAYTYRITAVDEDGQEGGWAEIGN
jgi:hypothetical protein